jgi:aspartyl protease family protein
MVLDRADDGHFYATAEADGDDYRMLVDTGASVVALTGDDAQRMGLDWDPNALAPVARGASGPVMGVPVTIPELAVGDFVARDVRAVIVPQGLAVSLLGQSFLDHVPKVAMAGDRLTLSN